MYNVYYNMQGIKIFFFLYENSRLKTSPVHTRNRYLNCTFLVHTTFSINIIFQNVGSLLCKYLYVCRQ